MPSSLDKMSSSNVVIVEIENGPVKGLKSKSVLQTDFISFRGIPYMKPPLGKLRFREPQTPKDWTEAFDATEEGPSYCMTDFMTGMQDGQENAGTINVYTKDLKPEKLRPVMIWVHGGGFTRGSSRTDLYGPDYLLEKDIVFVSFNYRLGVIGFLSLEDEQLEIPGNAGLKDQVMALRWIKANIEKFGGDPKQCTVFGESAGGGSVHYLMITNQTKDLFHRAIIMSGSSFNKTWALTLRNNKAQRLAQSLGWKGRPGNEREILLFLEDVPAFELDDACKRLFSYEEQFGYGLLVPFGPVIEPYISENCFLPKEPIEMARECWSNDIDLIVMGSSFEGILRASICEDEASKFLQNPGYFAPLMELGLKPQDMMAVEYGKKIKQLYYANGEQPSVENQDQYLRLNSDRHFWHGMYRVIQSRTAYATGKTFVLRFDVDGELNMFKELKLPNGKYKLFKGACHADDIFYIFNTVYHSKPSDDSNEYKTIQRMIGIFTSFAINGDPNCPETSNVQIKACDGTFPMKCVNLTIDGVAEIPLPEEDNMTVWNSIFEAHNVALF